MAKARGITQPPVAIVTSRYNASITDALRDGAIEAYVRAGGRFEDLALIPAPGSFELPALALAAARGGRWAGVVAIGCVIKGETSHDVYIAQAVVNGLVQVTIATGIPVALGVLTVDTPQQAKDRAGGSMGNKGHEAMTALLDTIAATQSLRAPRTGAAPGRLAKSEPASGARPDKARPRRGGGGRR
jgi:6,7-dimethyl-8-ribityllumazine synthase